MKYRLAKLSALAALALLSACRTPGSGSTESGAPVYRNLGSDATYVGKEVCRGCHATQYDTFIKAEMGRSFAKATLANSAADFENAKPVYDRFADLTYLPFAVGDSMYLMEYRVVGRDTV
ncbi:MAG: hypothetical protein KDB18_09900, partial [Salinibacterium sp.]|nr:hypothetical protein [Salinibacterium sp.]